LRARAGETVFLPRGVPHNWAAVGSGGRVLNTYQPAETMEEFVREVSRYKDPEIHEVLGLEGLQRLFKAHGMELTGPVPPGWAVIDGRIVRTAS
jgi:quercetin 2,3-dioxygenase